MTRVSQNLNLSASRRLTGLVKFVEIDYHLFHTRFSAIVDLGVLGVRSVDSCFAVDHLRLEKVNQDLVGWVQSKRMATMDIKLPFADLDAHPGLVSTVAPEAAKSVNLGGFLSWLGETRFFKALSRPRFASTRGRRNGRGQTG